MTYTTIVSQVSTHRCLNITNLAISARVSNNLDYNIHKFCGSCYTNIDPLYIHERWLPGSRHLPRALQYMHHPHAGTLLHFEDHGLKNIYFLDPQWLAKLMADVIRPAAVEEGSPIQNGQSALATLSMYKVYIRIYSCIIIFKLADWLTDNTVTLYKGLLGMVLRKSSSKI